MNRKTELQDALNKVHERIQTAKDHAGRTDDVTVVVVTKTYPVEDIHLLFELGVTDIGENKVQEIQRKKPDLPEGCHVHMIGSLQTNKVKALLGNVDIIQSLDRISLAEAINKRADESVNTLIEVNIADDDAKAGMSIESVPAFIQELEKYPKIRVLGMMVMGSHTDDKEKIRADFQRAKALYDRLKENETEQVQMQILSMGMSYDYEIAIEEGATMVRIGSAILGERGTA